MKKTIFLICFVLQLTLTFSQGQALKELKVGDYVPNIELTNILNHSSKTARLFDFKSQLLIIDFWATYCGPCVGSIPKLEGLQKTFAGKLKVLPITYEESEVVSNFFKKMTKANKVQPFLSITDDEKLNRYFPHTTLPHYIWIDNDAKVVAITGLADLTEQNIASYFHNKTFPWTLKEDNSVVAIGYPTFSPTLTLMKRDYSKTQRQMDSSNLRLFSILTKYVDGVRTGWTFDPSNYIYLANSAIKSLYRVAFTGNGLSLLNSFSGNIMIEVEDSILYNQITYENPTGKKDAVRFANWLKENGYCYELVTPHALEGERFNIMLTELNRYFGAVLGIEGVKEQRKNKYLALTRTSSINIKTKGGEKKVENTSFSLRVQNATLHDMIKPLFLPLQKYPIILDETGYTEKVDMELNCSLTKLEDVNRELYKYGLQLIEKEKLMEVGVIRVKKK